jgi:hypothetical protein
MKKFGCETTVFKHNDYPRKVRGLHGRKPRGHGDGPPNRRGGEGPMHSSPQPLSARTKKNVINFFGDENRNFLEFWENFRTFRKIFGLFGQMTKKKVINFLAAKTENFIEFTGKFFSVTRSSPQISAQVSAYGGS